MEVVMEVTVKVIMDVILEVTMELFEVMKKLLWKYFNIEYRLSRSLQGHYRGDYKIYGDHHYVIIEIIDVTSKAIMTSHYEGHCEVIMEVICEVKVIMGLLWRSLRSLWN